MLGQASNKNKTKEATGDDYLDGAAQNVFSSFYIQFIQNTNKLVLFINIHTSREDDRCQE